MLCVSDKINEIYKSVLLLYDKPIHRRIFHEACRKLKWLLKRRNSCWRLIVIDNKVIARSHNLTELLHDVTAHAEMQSITAAANYLGGKYLTGCTLYVTLEPCQMCWRFVLSQISKIVLELVMNNAVL
jgi:tRNA(Arg) A34 adenosine deaminase TadA